MKTVNLQPDFSEFNVSLLSENLLSCIPGNLSRDDFLIAIARKHLFSYDLLLGTINNFKFLACDKSFRKIKGSIENVSYADLDDLDVTSGSSSYLPKSVAINLYSKQNKIISIKCTTEKNKEGRYKITRQQSHALKNLLCPIDKISNLFNFDQQLEKLETEQYKACRLISLHEDVNVSSPQQCMENVFKNYILCALFAADEQEIRKLVDHSDIAIINIIRSSLNYIFNAVLKGQIKKVMKEFSDISIGNYIAALSQLFEYRYTLFTLLPQGALSYSSLHKYPFSILNSIKGEMGENSSSGFIDGFARTAAMISAGKTELDMFGFTVEKYQAGLSKIIGLQVDKINPPNTKKMDTEGGLRAFMDILNNEIDKIISERNRIR